MSTLHGEGDDEFWTQDYWQEGESDDDYSQESEEEDMVDSDFFDEEAASEDDEVKVEKEKDGNKKNVYTDKAKAAPQKKKGAPPVKNTPSAIRKVSSPSLSATKRKRNAHVEASVIIPDERLPGTVRSSARAATQENSHTVKQTIMARETKPAKARTKMEHRQWTQAERLAEAARTELINRKSLEDLLRLEELNKKKAMPVRVFFSGPRMVFRDKKGRTLLTFIDYPGEQSKSANSWPSIFKSLSVSPSVSDVCPITRLPARYKDPKTGIPYASVEAFRLIREYCRPSDDEDKPLSMKRNSSVGSCSSSGCGGCGSTVMGHSNVHMSHNLNNSSNNMQQQHHANDSFPPPPPPLSMHHTDPHQLQLQLLQQQQQHLQQLQSSPHAQHLHPFDTQSNANGANPHDLNAMQMQYSYAPFPQPYYKDVSYQTPNSSGLAQYHPDYQLQLQLQQMQQYPQ